MDVLMTVIRTARDMEVDWPMQTGEPGRSMELILACREPEEAEEILHTLCLTLTGIIRESRVENGKRISQLAVAFMKANYMNSDMGLEKTCRHLHISAAYFSTLFKREMKKTFHQYLTELRMDKAMTLLIGSDMKTADIAMMVGMGEPSYFSYSFKKHFGISPSQARRNAKEARP